jgi:hypothetical protein
MYPLTTLTNYYHFNKNAQSPSGACKKAQFILAGTWSCCAAFYHINTANTISPVEAFPPRFRPSFLCGFPRRSGAGFGLCAGGSPVPLIKNPEVKIKWNSSASIADTRLNLDYLLILIALIAVVKSWTTSVMILPPPAPQLQRVNIILNTTNQINTQNKNNCENLLKNLSTKGVC